jgi:hypothetical protein
MHQRVLHGVALAAVAVVLLGTAMAAEPAKPRFALDSARDGFMRLDTQTGSVTHCSALNGKWSCDAVLPADTNLGPRVEALATEVARLATETAALAARVEQLAQNAASTPTVQSSSVGQPVRAVASQPVARRSVSDRIVGRLLAMVRLLKHGKGAIPPATPS